MKNKQNLNPVSHLFINNIIMLNLRVFILNWVFNGVKTPI
jgi:hypothetical protein